MEIPGWRAESAGWAPGPATSPAAIALLQASGLGPPGRAPRAPTPELLRSADRIILFRDADRRPPELPVPFEEWPVSGGFGRSDEERREIFEEIRRRVRELAERLSPPRPR